MTRDAAQHGWCSLRLRFDQRELELLKGAEQLRGRAMARTPRPDVLRTALNLAKAGHKVGSAVPGGAISLDEGELKLLLEALRFASQEVPWVARPDSAQDAARRGTVVGAFPELAQKGMWRSFGLSRELDALAARLVTALSS